MKLVLPVLLLAVVAFARFGRRGPMHIGMGGALQEAGMWIVGRRPGHPAHVSAFPLLMTTFRVHAQK
jgi:hypothetical protein